MDLELLKQQTPSAYPTVATAMGTYAFYAFASYAADAVGSRSVTGSGSLYYLRHYGTNGTTATASATTLGTVAFATGSTK
jgi:hypothetical protein